MPLRTCPVVGSSLMSFSESASLLSTLAFSATAYLEDRNSLDLFPMLQDVVPTSPAVGDNWGDVADFPRIHTYLITFYRRGKLQRSDFL